MALMYSAAAERMRTVWTLGPLLWVLFVYMSGVSAIIPTTVDVLLGALCPGQVECSEVIMLSGLQTAITGIGAMVLAPFLGGLSDSYGRKPVFLFVVISSIVPSLILAYSRETVYVCAWWVLELFDLTLRHAGLLTITFAFLADIVPDSRQRAPAFGIAMASVSIGMLGGTLVARVLKTDQIFAFAAALQIAAAVVLKVFVIESHPKHRTVLQVSAHEDDPEKLAPLITKRDQKSIVTEIIGAVRHSHITRIAAVAFMSSISETTLQTTLLYYLKAEFFFGKDEFSQLMILGGSLFFISQMVFYPVLAHCIGEQGVLSVGLLGGVTACYLYAFAWAAWSGVAAHPEGAQEEYRSQEFKFTSAESEFAEVPYLACSFGVLYALIPAAIGTIVSRGADADEQGKLQGLIASAKTVASVVGPIFLTPLTAAFLSDDPPFHFPGFTLMIGGMASVVGLIISLWLPRLSTPDTCFETVVPTADDEIIIISAEDADVIEGKEEKPVES